jgi:hypothetical protein
MSVSEALSYYSNVLSGFSTSTMKLTPSSKTSSVVSGDVTSISLPSNSIIDMRSFRVYFKCAITGATARLPPGTSSLLRRVEVVCGGVTLSQGTNLYSVLRSAKSALCGPMDNKQSGNPYLVRDADEFTGLAIGTAENPDAPQPSPSSSAFIGTQESSFCVDNWEGFLGSVEPKLLDSALLGDINVLLYWNDDSVLTSSTNKAAATALVAAEGTGFTQSVAANAKYTINSLFATIDCISLADNSFDEMVANQMQTSGFLELPFTQWYCQSEATASGTSRFQVATQSLNRIWVGYRYNGTNVTGAVATGRQYDHQSQGPPIPVLGYTPNPVFTTRHGTTEERYTTAQQCFRTPGPDFSLQWSLNGSLIPQTPVFGSELMSFTKNQLPEYKYIRDDLTAAEYLTSSFVTCLRLDMPHVSGSRLQSGLDTRGSSLQALVRGVGGSPNNYDAFIGVETGATLRVMPGRSIAVVP